MNVDPDAAAGLAQVIEQHRDEVLERWMQAVLDAPPGHYRDFTREEVAAWLDRTLRAVESSLASGSAAPLREHATNIGIARQRLGFNIEEVIEALLRLKDAVATTVLKAPPCAPDGTRCCLRALDEVLRVMLASFSARFADSLREQLQRVSVLEERNRLARELHDSVSQSVYAVHLQAEAAIRLLAAGDQETAACRLRELRDDAQQALRDMRLLVFELRPSTILEEGLVAALRMRLETVERRSGIRVELDCDDQEPSLGHDQEETLYGIIREALNNVVKHSAARRVRLELRLRDDPVTIRIVDDGIGFEPPETNHGGGIGLAAMTERAQRLGAVLRLSSRPGEGTEVLIEMPRTAATSTHRPGEAGRAS